MTTSPKELESIDWDEKLQIKKTNKTKRYEIKYTTFRHFLKGKMKQDAHELRRSYEKKFQSVNTFTQNNKEK